MILAEGAVGASLRGLWAPGLHYWGWGGFLGTILCDGIPGGSGPRPSVPPFPSLPPSPLPFSFPSLFFFSFSSPPSFPLLSISLPCYSLFFFLPHFLPFSSPFSPSFNFLFQMLSISKVLGIRGLSRWFLGS